MPFRRQQECPQDRLELNQTGGCFRGWRAPQRGPAGSALREDPWASSRVGVLAWAPRLWPLADLRL